MEQTDGASWHCIGGVSAVGAALCRCKLQCQDRIFLIPAQPPAVLGAGVLGDLFGGSGHWRGALGGPPSLAWPPRRAVQQDDGAWELGAAPLGAPSSPVRERGNSRRSSFPFLLPISRKSQEYVISRNPSLLTLFFLSHLSTPFSIANDLWGCMLSLSPTRIDPPRQPLATAAVGSNRTLRPGRPPLPPLDQRGTPIQIPRRRPEASPSPTKTLQRDSPILLRRQHRQSGP